MQAMFGDAARQQAQTREPVTIVYRESAGLLWLSIKNFLLSVITLSIYRFWGKTHVRRHIWSNVRINDEPLEYTGTGMELFLGALVVFVILVVPVVGGIQALTLIYGSEHPATLGFQFAVFIVFIVLYGMAIYRARRYRLSRTQWRGVRGALTGSPTSFTFLYFGAMLLRAITLGWSTPAMNLNIQERMIGDMQFGDSSFMFAGPAGPLYTRYAVCWFLTPLLLGVGGYVLFATFNTIAGLDWAQLTEFFMNPEGTTPPDDTVFVTLMFTVLAAIMVYVVIYGVLWTFYTAREMNLFASYTTLQDARFRLDATVPSLIGLWLGNLAIMIFTLGIGQPYVQQRLIRYICDRIAVDGRLNLAVISQSTAELDRRGEGLVEAFDIDAF